MTIDVNVIYMTVVNIAEKMSENADFFIENANKGIVYSCIIFVQK